jgi:hypothetical protein
MTPADLACALIAHPRWEQRFVRRRPRPKLAESTTAGVLLAMLLEVEDEVHVHRSAAPGALVRLGYGLGSHDYEGATLGEALARALLDVWGPA